MSDATNPLSEHIGTYFVQNRSNREELAHLQLQDQLLTAGMGGVLPEQANATAFQRVLDVGCGTGGWLIEAAKAYPQITFLIGVDVSDKMVEYARAQAVAQQVNGRVEFHVMNVLRSLEFPSDYFDLINLRLGYSYLRTWDWSRLLQEFQRIGRPGGVIRITEADDSDSNAPNLQRINRLLTQAFCESGHIFTTERNGMGLELKRIFQQYGPHQDMQISTHLLEYRAGTVEGETFCENIKYVIRTMAPFLYKWTDVKPEEYEALCQQALGEIEQPDFVATWKLRTVWGNLAPEN